MAFVKNADLMAALVQSHKEGEPTADLVRMWQALVDGIASRWNWKHYTDLPDWKQDAMLRLAWKWRNFDCSARNNPVAYFTTVITNEFRIGVNALHERQARTDAVIAVSGPEFEAAGGEWLHRRMVRDMLERREDAEYAKWVKLGRKRGRPRKNCAPSVIPAE